MTNLILDVLRVITAFCFLGYAAWSDWKTREVKNNVWIFFAPLASGLTFLDIFLTYRSYALVSWAFSFVATLVASLILFYIGFFGGADAKALICLSLALPFVPATFHPWLSLVQPWFPYTVFMNAVVFAASTAIFMLIINIRWKLVTKRSFFKGLEKEPKYKKFLVLLTSRKLNVEELAKKPYYYLVERIIESPEGKVELRLQLFPKVEENFAKTEDLLKGKALAGEVWATPALPMLVHITAGLIIALFVGDVFLWLIFRFLAILVP